ncbi:MAG: cyclic nucleotide-binding domain-containing protein [Beijerinckiaceae bacterium]
MTIELEVKALQTLNMFRDVPAIKLKLLAMVSDRVTFKPNEMMLRRGDHSDAAYIILEGSIAIRIAADHGSEESRVIHHSGPILIGEVGVLCGRARSATIVATSVVTALRIPGEDFVRLIKDTPDIAFAIMRQLAEQVDLKSRYVVENFSGGVAASQ